MNVTTSSNIGDVKLMVVGGLLFASESNDLNPSIIIDIQPRILFSLELLNGCNIKDYDMQITFEDNSLQLILVSSINFELISLSYYIFTIYMMKRLQSKLEIFSKNIFACNVNLIISFLF